MVSTKPSRAQKIRASLDHPIVDADGHVLELSPVILDYVQKYGGTNIRDRFEKQLNPGPGETWFTMTPQQRWEGWNPTTPWWFVPTTNSLDRATATIPRLLNERMDELGLDYAILYPTLGLGFERLAGDDVRLVACRALNACAADLYGPYAYRMTPAAIVPMDTPEIAIQELEFAVNELGLKTIMLPGRAYRPVAKYQRQYPDAADLVQKVDVIGLDSDYDYDPFWAKCMELGVAPATHGSDFNWGAMSISNYMFNHLSTFAIAHDVFAKALFIGGVTTRFPDLNVAFLEGGVAWACNLYSDLVGHWEKRNGTAIQNLDPRRLDQEMVLDLVREYGEDRMQDKLAQIQEFYATPDPSPDNLDDWSHVPMDSAEEIVDRFVEPFYFGCEADDPMNTWAFNKKVNPFGAQLKAIFSSDIGHWDVPDMREVVEEAYELVEHELITQDDFKDFVFANTVNLYGKMNPDFFKGTAVEAAAAKELST